MLSAGSRARRAAREKRTQDHPQRALIKAGREDVEVGYPPPPPQWPATQGQMERTLGLESGSVSTWPGKVPLSARLKRSSLRGTVWPQATVCFPPVSCKCSSLTPSAIVWFSR